LLSDHIVFRTPFVQSPIPGRTAGDFAGADDRAADFREFSLSPHFWNRIGSQLTQLEAAALSMTVFEDPAGRFPRLRGPGPCGKDRRAL
jgi:hypothetical protein